MTTGTSTIYIETVPVETLKIDPANPRRILEEELEDERIEFGVEPA